MAAVTGLKRRAFGETGRRDRWWLPPVAVATGLSAFIVYTTWAVFQGDARKNTAIAVPTTAVP